MKRAALVAVIALLLLPASGSSKQSLARICHGQHCVTVFPVWERKFQLNFRGPGYDWMCWVKYPTKGFPRFWQCEQRWWN